MVLMLNSFLIIIFIVHILYTMQEPHITNIILNAHLGHRINIETLECSLKNIFGDKVCNDKEKDENEDDVRYLRGLVTTKLMIFTPKRGVKFHIIFFPSGEIVFTRITNIVDIQSTWKLIRDNI